MGTRIPTVRLTTPTGLEICPDGSNIRLTMFDCKWKDDGKDDIELGFESRNVALLHSCGFVYEGLVYMSFGYTDGNMSDTIPYIIRDVTRKYTEKGLSTNITLSSLSSPLDIMSPDSDAIMDENETDEYGPQEDNQTTTIMQSPLEYIMGVCGENLELVITHKGKVGFKSNKVKKGNGYIPPQFVWDSYNVIVRFLGGGSKAPYAPGMDPDEQVYLGPYRDNSILERPEEDKKVTAKDLGDLPDSVKEFLLTPRIINTTANKIMAVINQILSFMPEGPWYVTRRGNLFLIHGRGITGNHQRQFNFYSDDNTILNCTIKYNADDLDKDKAESSGQDPTLRTVSKVVQYNTALKTMEDIYNRVLNNNPKAFNTPSSLYIEAKPYYEYDSKYTEGPYVGQGVVEANRQGLMLNQNTVYTLDGMKVSLEDYDAFRAAYATAQSLQKDVGIEKVYLYEYEAEEDKEGNPVYRSGFAKIIDQLGSGTAHGNAGANAKLPQYEPITKVKHNTFYTIDSINKKTKKPNEFSGHLFYIQPQISSDAVWNVANKLMAASMNGVTATVTIEGDPTIMDGMVVKLTGLGADTGNYYIKSVRHSISGSGGYKTTMEMCRQVGDTSTIMLNEVREFTNYDPEDIRRRFIDSVIFGVNTRFIWNGPSNPQAWPTDMGQEGVDKYNVPTDGSIAVGEAGVNYVKPNDPKFQQAYIDAARARGIDQSQLK